MTSETLKLWGNGAVTLPKEWRERYGTKHFLARENERGYLVIMPILDVEYWEKEDGSCGLHFPHGIEMGEFGKLMDEVGEKIHGKRGYQKIKKMSEKKLPRKTRTQKG